VSQIQGRIEGLLKPDWEGQPQHKGQPPSQPGQQHFAVGRKSPCEGTAAAFQNSSQPAKTAARSEQPSPLEAHRSESEVCFLCCQHRLSCFDCDHFCFLCDQGCISRPDGNGFSADNNIHSYQMASCQQTLCSTNFSLDTRCYPCRLDQLGSSDHLQCRSDPCTDQQRRDCSAVDSSQRENK